MSRSQLQKKVNWKKNLIRTLCIGLQNFPSKKNTARVNGIWRAENSLREKGEGDGFLALAPHNMKTLGSEFPRRLKATKNEKHCQRHNGPKALSL